MKQILESKFEQVPEFKERVLQCNDKTKFVEAAYDDYWGSGLDKRGTHNTATTAWPWKNVMGNILTSTKAYWAHLRREKNYIFRKLTRNFCELTRNFRELTRNFRE